eukprot:3938424-Rhodomonas_salina.1
MSSFPPGAEVLTWRWANALLRPLAGAGGGAGGRVPGDVPLDANAAEQGRRGGAVCALGGCAAGSRGQAARALDAAQDERAGPIERERERLEGLKGFGLMSVSLSESKPHARGLRKCQPHGRELGLRVPGEACAPSWRC